MKLCFPQSGSKFLPKVVINNPKLEQNPNYFDYRKKKIQSRTGKSFVSNYNPVEPSFILYISTNDNIFSTACHQMEKTP